MSPPFLRALFAAVLGLATACTASGDGSGGSAQNGSPAQGAPLAAGRGAAATPYVVDPIAARDVAILVLEQTPSSLRVIGHNRRPRASFGPIGTWNGAGPSTHRWRLVGRDGDVVASGDIAVRRTVEVPPDPARGSRGTHVALETLSFTVKVPSPEPGEAIEIATADGSALVARWP